MDTQKNINAHYIFGLRGDFLTRTWEYFNYLSIKSFKKFNPNFKIHFWYIHKPSGKWWQKSTYLIDEFHQIKLDDFLIKQTRSYKCLNNFLKFIILKQLGGIYIDSDIICLKSFKDLLLDNKNCIPLIDSTPQNFLMYFDKDSNFLKEFLGNINIYSQYVPNLLWVEIFSSLLKKYKEETVTFDMPLLKNKFKPWKNSHVFELFKESRNRILDKNYYIIHLNALGNYDTLKNINEYNINKNSELWPYLFFENIETIYEK